MYMFSASDVKELREKTGAGMMDCKKALDACEGNMEKAIDWLREKGIAKAAKKESRIAAEGITEVIENGNEAVLLEVNCETDFVTKNEKFTVLVNEIRDALANSSCKTMEEANEVKLSDGKTIAERIIEETATIGEKISFRRFERVTKSDDEVFGIYSHMGGKITAVVVLKGTNSEVARDIAMQVCAMSPIAVNRDNVPTEMVEHEKEVILAEIKNDEKNASKSEEILDKMATGRLSKFFKENCLVEQDFIKDSSMTVAKYAEANGCEVLSMVRYAVGEGIEKRQENFAEEVAAQIDAAN
ncbi:MAG: elongation factor Ts [Bacilli bacterium]|nr:elongation factor Ts [Bacilli bacterium]